VLHFKRFGQYEILRKLGRSMTDVYLALDSETNRKVALKIIEESRDPATQLAIEAERRGVVLQKQLREIDSRILEVYDYGESNGCFFVALEYVEGKSIAEIIEAEKRLEPARAAFYAREVCSQLDRLHSFSTEIDGRKRAVIHGDIKPSNIQIGPDDQVRLLDFGIAKAITFTHNLTHHNLGSPSYCSPERLTKGQVDHYVDLWATGVTLYEMVAGSPPYQAQTTRKLENLIQSRRQPRALPASCPPTLRAIVYKALAANIERRYTTAAEFEHDLALFLEGKPALAELEKDPPWDSNETLEKSPETLPPRRRKLEIGAVLGDFDLRKFNFVLSSLAAGFLIGLFLLLPGVRAVRFWSESGPLQRPKDYSHRSMAEVGADWNLYKKLERTSTFLGPISTVRQPFRASLVAAADDVIEHYDNSSDPSIAHFDWQKAQFCLARALELDPSDNNAKGKLALCDGYLSLLRNPPAAKAAKASFEEAASYLRRSPDPHLGLARLYVYSLRNVGSAVAEFHQAERLGFKLGPREMEQQADGYLARAQFELLQAERARKASRPEEARYLSQAHRDFERANALYEPIDGFSKVGPNLQHLYKGRSRQEQLQADYELAKQRRRLWR
jgi:eukaryotic-like serine/threonine-protein kinase